MCTKLPLSSHFLCCGNSHLSHQQLCSAARHKLLTSATTSASAGKNSAVQAEFAKAGISAEVTQKVVKQYKHYLTWDIETKLRPALQLWLQQLGTEQLSQQLQKVRRLLVGTPKERTEVYSWLVSKGVNAERVQQRAPHVMIREIGAVQSTYEALQQAAAFSDTQMCALVHKHCVALAYAPEKVVGMLQAVSAMLSMPITSDSFSGCQWQTVSYESSHCSSACDIFLPDVCHWDPCSQDSNHDSRACDANQSSKASRAAGLGQ